MLSLYLGDYISPILLSMYLLAYQYWGRSLLYILLSFHEPLYILPRIANKDKGFNGKKVAALTAFIILAYLYRDRYLYYPSILSSRIDLLVIQFILLIFSIIIFKLRGLYTLSTFISPYVSTIQLVDQYEYRVNRITYRYIYGILAVLISLSFIGSLYLGVGININFNGSIDEFILESIGNASIVLSLSKDPYINSILSTNGIYVVEYGDSLTWNWSDRLEVMERLSEALEYAENHGIRYILIDKPSELAYWVSPKHYSEYKYPLREPLGRYIIVLERRGLVETAEKYFYVSSINLSSDYLLNNLYIRYWSNISLDVSVEDEYIEIISNKSYEVYLHFKPKSLNGTYLFILGDLDGYTRSVEFYVYNGELKSLWESSRKSFYNPIAVDIKSSIDGELVFKVEDDDPVIIRLYRLEKPELYDVRVDNSYFYIESTYPNSYIILSTFNDDYMVELEYNVIEEIDRVDLFSWDIIYITSFLSTSFFIGYSLDKSRYKEEDPIEEGSIPITYGYLYLLSIPIIIYIVHPRLLEISWIGGGVFVIALSMGLFTLLLESKMISYKKFVSMNLLTLTIFAVSYIIKYLYGDIFDLVGDFWRNQSLYAGIDVLVYGLIGLFISIYIFGSRLVYLHTPFIYLTISGSSFITDLLRISNPVLQGLIDVATYLVDFTMELLGYRIEYITVPAGNAIYVYDPTLKTIVILGWPCTGITGIFIFLSFSMVLNRY